MPVHYEKRGAVGVVTLSRPEARNAWGEDYNEGLYEHFVAMEDDDDVLCAVLTGDAAGGAFSAGAYLKSEATHSPRGMDHFIKGIARDRQRPFDVLAGFAKPLVAAVNGYAIGIGAIVTFCCDLIVASERAEWRLPQTALGIMPAYGGSTRLARWVGKGHAMKLAMGFPLPAEEAYRIGLAQWVAPHEQMMDRALEVADHIAGLAPLSTRIAKESLLRGMDTPNLADASHVDLYRFMALSMTEDRAEAHGAWREGRREPEFKGR